jgi:hypothetical protein
MTNEDPIKEKHRHIYESTTLLWRAFKHLERLYDEDYMRQELGHPAPPTKVVSERPRYRHPHARRPKEDAPLSPERLSQSELEHLIRCRLEFTSRKDMKLRSSDPVEIAEMGIKRFKRRSLKRVKKVLNSLIPEASRAEALELAREEERRRLLTGDQENAFGFLLKHARWIYKGLKSHPHLTDPLDDPQRFQRDPIHPAHTQGRSDHKAYAGERFSARLYADLYAHLTSRGFFEALTEKTRSPNLEYIVDEWRAQLEAHTRALEPDELPWRNTRLAARDVVTTTHTPVACSREVDVKLLNYLEHFKAKGLARGDSPTNAYSYWKRGRKALREALSELIASERALLSDEDQARLLALSFEEASPPEPSEPAAPAAPAEPTAPAEDQISRDLKLASDCLQMRGHTQLCNLNHSPEECDLHDLSLTDPVARWCALYAARALFEVLSRERAFKCPQGKLKVVTSAQESKEL